MKIEKLSDRKWTRDQLLLHWQPAAKGVAWSALGSILFSVQPLLLRTLIDGALPQRNILEAVGLASGMGGLFAARAGCDNIASLYAQKAFLNCAHDLRVKMLTKLTEMLAGFHNGLKAGEAFTWMDRDVESIARTIGDAPRQTVSSVLFLMMSVAAMLYLDWKLALAVSFAIPASIILQLMFRSKITKYAEIARNAVGNGNNTVAEIVCAMLDIQALNAEPHALRHSTDLWNAARKVRYAQRRAELAFGFSINLVLAGTLMLLLSVGSYRVVSGAMSIGTLMAFQSYMWRICDPLNQAMDMYARSLGTTSSRQRVQALLETGDTVSENMDEHEAPLSDRTQDLELKNVTLRYGGTPVLNEVSLHIQEGTHLALIGPSGSGKSSLAKLIVRFVEPSDGSITLNGKRLDGFSRRLLRTVVAYTAQQTVLFDATVKQNLELAGDVLSDEDAWEALRTVQLEEKIASLPSGIHTNIGPGGVLLSGGERQRLAIARTILRNGAITILDEATSALDIATEARLIEALRRRLVGRILILITHRVHTVSNFDQLVVLEKGCVSASGIPQNLMKTSQFYRSLVSYNHADLAT